MSRMNSTARSELEVVGQSAHGGGSSPGSSMFPANTGKANTAQMVSADNSFFTSFSFVRSERQSPTLRRTL